MTEQPQPDPLREQRQQQQQKQHVLIFQDLLERNLAADDDDEEQDGDDNNKAVSLTFFELANASEIAYRLTTEDDDYDADCNQSKTKLLTLKQDVSACGQHTGGIVWESSVLLLKYLLHSPALIHGKRIVEVGAGCGLLGLGLAAAAKPSDVVVTETATVLSNLQINTECNKELYGCSVRACLLDWTNVHTDAADLRGSADLVLGTDVVFTTTLVEPLLQTIDHLLSTANGAVAYLCVHVRCTEAHSQFLNQAVTTYKFDLQEITAEELQAIPSCKWGPSMDCLLFRLTRVKPVTTVVNKSKKKKRKRPDENSSGKEN